MKDLSYLAPGLGMHPGSLGQHLAALSDPHELERPIVHGIRAWLEYAVLHEERYEAPIGDDPYTGEVWFRWGEALHDLLTCETGRLDCGTLSAIIYGNMKEQGFKDD